MKKLNIDEKCINTIRMLSVDAVQKANSGHPGMPMGDAPMAYVLYSKIMKHNPGNPFWQNRDRFVLSAGHGSMLLYSLLHLTGYGISLYGKAGPLGIRNTASNAGSRLPPVHWGRVLQRA